jgi:hypothetical protein
MDEFIKINNTLINMERVLAVQYQPPTIVTYDGGETTRTEEGYYLVSFDTGKQVRLSSEDGALLMNNHHLSKPPDGMTATTSESAR